VLGIYLVYKTSNSSKKCHPVHRKNPRKSPEKKEPYKETDQINSTSSKNSPY
jgi:hypothetical protein